MGHKSFAAVVLVFIALPYLAASAEVTPAKSIDDLTLAVKETKAKVVWLNIWATECSPCMAEMPVLASLAKKYKNNADVAFVGICLPSESAVKRGAKTAAATIIEKKGLPYRNLLWLGTAEALQTKFNITGTPYNAVLTLDGKVLDEVDVPGNEAKAAEVIEQAIQKALKTVAGNDSKK